MNENILILWARFLNELTANGKLTWAQNRQARLIVAEALKKGQSEQTAKKE